MSRKLKMPAGIMIFIFMVLAIGTWTYATRAAYESAEYKVVDSEGSFEMREYPELTVVTTPMRSESNRENGSFMRLFRYISGANANEQKVAMTTPVFTRSDNIDADRGQMAFVLPKSVAKQGAPEPTQQSVQINRRPAGTFAVLRFSGRMNRALAEKREQQLRRWIEQRELTVDGPTEFAGYDPPWTPGPLRRNEVMLRVK